MIDDDVPSGSGLESRFLSGSFDSPIRGGSDGRGAGRGAGRGGSRGNGFPLSILPVLDGTGRPHRPMEINVSSRESVRIEMEADNVYKEKETLAGLAHL